MRHVVVPGQVYGENHHFPEARALAFSNGSAASTPCDLIRTVETNPKACKVAGPLHHFTRQGLCLGGGYSRKLSQGLAVSQASKAREGGVGKPPVLSQIW